MKDVEWTLRISGEFLVRVKPMDEDASSFGYRIIEADRAGKLDIERARAYGIIEGMDFGTLKRGQP